jgi:hypothetical protein
MWSTDSRWFDVAAFSTLWVVLGVLFGKFEQHKPAWRRLSKKAALLILLLVRELETHGDTRTILRRVRGHSERSSPVD